MASVIDEDQVWQDTDGKPIVSGFIHIGVQGQDPLIAMNKITIYSDRELNTSIANPQTTDSFGRSTNKIWVPEKYSITVQNSASAQKYSELDAGETPATGITNLTNVAGADTITADASPTITAYTDKEIYIFTSIGTNTGAVTLAIDAVGAIAVLKYHDQALAAGDLEINQVVAVMYNGTDDTFEIQSSTAAQNFPEAITVGGTAKFSKGADLTTSDVTAGALALGTDGNYFDFTGTDTITSIDTVGVGTVIKLHFDAIAPLTHNATDLVLPSGVDITTAAGDEFEFIEYALGDWRLTNSTRALPDAGEFTAALVSSGGSITMNIAQDTLRYLKSGSLVFIFGALGVDTVSAPTGTLTLETLPFVPASSTEISDQAEIPFFHGLTGNVGIGIIRIAAGDDTPQLTFADLTALASSVTNADLASFSFSYFTDD